MNNLPLLAPIIFHPGFQKTQNSPTVLQDILTIVIHVFKNKFFALCVSKVTKTTILLIRPNSISFV